MAEITYETVTDECVKAFGSTGAKTVTDALTSALAAGPDQPYSEAVKNILYELLWRVTEGQVKPADAASLLNSLDQDSFGGELPSLIVDLSSFLSFEIDALDDTQMKLNLVTFLSLMTKTLLATDTLKERLEPAWLEELGIVPNSKLFSRSEVRYRTKLFYTQQKYNLLREESEGYSKILTELNAQGDDSVTMATVDSLASNIRSLIGYFHLDPNRVADLVLEAHEMNLSNKAYLTLVRLFRPETVCQTLGFKFQYYQRQDVRESAPKSLYRLAATLIKEGLLEWRSISAHLSPSDEEAVSAAAKSAKGIVSEARSLTMMSLAPKSDDQDKDGKKEKDACTVAANTAAANQKLGVLEALVYVGDWARASKLLVELAPMRPIFHLGTMHQMCSLLHHLIDPLYRQIFWKGPKALPPSKYESLHGIAVVKEWADLPALLKTVFVHLRHQIHRDVVLYAKVCRLLKKCLTEVPDSVPAVMDVLSLALLPALALFKCNPGMNYEVWSILKSLNYQQRYELYGHWKNESYTGEAHLVLARAKSISAAKHLLRRISADNHRILGRQLGKVSHQNCMVAMVTILEQLQAYNNLIQPVVESLKFMTPMSFDVMSYVLIEQLSGAGRPKLKPDGTNISQWLQSLATFCGAVYRRYPSTELNGLIQYLTRQMRDGSTVDLLVLQELLSRMGHIDVILDMSPEMLQSRAGGDNLRTEANIFSQGKKSRAASTSLSEALHSNNITIPLYILIARLRASMIFTTKIPHLKLVGDLVDKCQFILVQYTDFLSAQQSSVKEYKDMLPSMETLSTEYGLAPEIIMVMYRPVLAAAKYKPKAGSRLRESDDRTPEQRFAEADVYISSIRSIMPESAKQGHLNPDLYSTFWSATAYDVFIPKDQYNANISRLRQSIGEAEEALAKNPYDKNLKKQKARHAATLDNLQVELREHESHHKKFVARLKANEAMCRTDSTPENIVEHRKSQICMFLQSCIFPRIMLTLEDAFFCAKFVPLLCEAKVPGFNIIFYLQRVFKDLVGSLMQCTDAEATRLAVFFYETLKLVEKWGSSSRIYNTECKPLAAFKKNHDPDNDVKIKYEEFLGVSFVWHGKLAAILQRCLQSKEYMNVRNAIGVLNKVVKHFPRTKKHAKIIDGAIQSVIDTDPREDLKLAAKQYSAHLTQRKSSLQTDEEFKRLPPKKTTSSSGKDSSSKSSKDSSSKSSKDSVSKSSSKSNGSSQSKSSASNDKESSSRDDRRSSSSRSGRESSSSKSQSERSSSSSVKKEKESSSKHESSSRGGKSSTSSKSEKDTGSSSTKESSSKGSSSDNTSSRKRGRESGSSGGGGGDSGSASKRKRGADSEREPEKDSAGNSAKRPRTSRTQDSKSSDKDKGSEGGGTSRSSSSSRKRTSSRKDDDKKEASSSRGKRSSRK